MLTITVVLRDTTPKYIQLLKFCAVRLQKCLQLLWFCAARLQNAYNYCGFAWYDSKMRTIIAVLRDTRTNVWVHCTDSGQAGRAGRAMYFSLCVVL